ncbi:MAG: hypothetical protein H6Q74_2926 [Firmicutes bacterium]|nr:hypothetical protein [Bacillota bacterium]
MPTVECDRKDCDLHGIEICIAKRVRWENGSCLDYRPRLGRAILEAPFNANCYRVGGRYRSSRVTGVLK